MARMEWLAVSLSLLMLACSSSVPVAPAATPAASPEQELVVIDSLLPKIPPTKLQFGAASCFLWNPRLNDGDSFYAVVVQGGGVVQGSIKSPSVTPRVAIFSSGHSRPKGSRMREASWA